MRARQLHAGRNVRRGDARHGGHRDASRHGERDVGAVKRHVNRVSDEAAGPRPSGGDAAAA